MSKTKRRKGTATRLICIYYQGKLLTRVNTSGVARGQTYAQYIDTILDKYMPEINTAHTFFTYAGRV